MISSLKFKLSNILYKEVPKDYKKEFPLKTNNKTISIEDKQTIDALRNMYPHSLTNFRNSQTLPRIFAKQKKIYAI